MKTKILVFGSIICPKCEHAAVIELSSWGEPTKHDTCRHGIEAKCKYCDTIWQLTEDES